MPRADLHYALAVDREIYEASRVDPNLLDPVVRVDEGLPGTARPFLVIRHYQGPQGAYVEQFLLADGRGRELARSRRRRIQLEGEMFEDRFASVLRDVAFSDGAEHQLTFFLDDDVVGTVPVFVEAGLGGDPQVAMEETFRKALQKGTIIWLTVPQPGGGSHNHPVWFVYQDNRVYVFSGPTEQQVPHLAEASEVEITARSKEVRSRVSRVPATVRVVSGDDERFDAVATSGLAKRLNLPDLGDAALKRWKANLVLAELTPRFHDEEQPRGAAAPPAAEAPPDVPASRPEPPPTVEQEPHVEAQIDQAVFDRLIAEGASERVARAKAKAAHVRAERARLRAEREKAAS